MADSSEVPSLTLSNGYKVPQLGFGTWHLVEPNKVRDSVIYAIGVGYRHIDCAYCYDNEDEVGAAIKQRIDNGTVKREDLFILSKLWNTQHRKDLVRPAFMKSLNMLGLDYLDAYLIHWPYAFQAGHNRFPKDADGNMITADPDPGFMEAYQEIEKLVDEGLVRSIGFANFNSEQIQRVWDSCRIKPTILQVELNPYMRQEGLVNFAKEKEMVLIGYSPLGSPDRVWKKDTDPCLLQDPLMVEIAAKHNRSTAAIALRFNIERGVCVIPKSFIEREIDENFQVFSFKLDEEDMEKLCTKIPNNFFRGIAKEEFKDIPNYPFNLPF